MNDVSILLNFTGKIAFELTDPMMDLVSGHGPYLFYDQISRERFPLSREEQDKHARRLLTDLRNLLENRRLSTEDKGGEIRLHILIDLAGSFLHRPEEMYCFPAQKVRRFKEMLNKVFGQNPQLLARFRYTFIFIECDTDEKQLANFYRGQAYDGYGGFPTEWLSSDIMDLNSIKKIWIESLNSPLEEQLLTDPTIRYSSFTDSLQLQVDKVTNVLEKACVADSFRNNISAAFNELKSIGDVKEMDFNKLVSTEVSKLIGLRYASDKDTAFFIFKHQTGTETERRLGEVVLSSLLQLLGTLDDKTYTKTMGMVVDSDPKFFVMDAQANVCNLDENALAQLNECISTSLKKFRDDGSLKWNKNKQVSYYEYSAKNTEPEEIDDYKELNDELKQQRSALFEDFQKVRQVPFVFGTEPGDWHWFGKVSKVLDEIYSFESRHDRPLVSSLRRITEKEMNFVEKKSSYSTLESIRDGLVKERPARNPKPGMKDYLKNRENSLAHFMELKVKVKEEMVKLGFATTTGWISFLSAFLITLCYSFYFIYVGKATDIVWVLLAFVAACVIISIAFLLAWISIKSNISAAFDMIHSCLTVDLQGKQEEYREAINKLIKEQNKADIRKKNLDELNEKIEEFERHNRKVELWETHFQNMYETIIDIQALLPEGNELDHGKTNAINDSEFHIEEMPSLPVAVSQRFRTMKTSLSTGQTLENITCFLKRLDITCVK